MGQRPWEVSRRHGGYRGWNGGRWWEGREASRRGKGSPHLGTPADSSRVATYQPVQPKAAEHSSSSKGDAGPSTVAISDASSQNSHISHQLLPLVRECGPAPAVLTWAPSSAMETGNPVVALHEGGLSASHELAVAIAPVVHDEHIGWEWSPKDLQSGVGDFAETWVSFSGFAGFEAEAETISKLEGEAADEWCWSGAEAAAFLAAQHLQGDETLPGPDGALYEVFYPPIGAPGEPSGRSSTPRSADSVPVDTMDADSEASTVAPETDLASFEHSWKLRCKTSTEACMLETLASMRNHTASQYEARAQLFKAARAAAEEALGEHFERVSLVGSTAYGIDTPYSDLDIVVFTRPSPNAPVGNSTPPPLPIEALRRITSTLTAHNLGLRLELIECARVPLLVVWTADGSLSLDLSVDQPLAEQHARWFRSVCWEQPVAPELLGPLSSVPVPATDDENGLPGGFQASVLRCMKLWLKMRRLPVTKEGGFPSLVWMLMAIYALRCSVFANAVGSVSGGCCSENARGRMVLSALAAFFDRFAERHGLSGTLLFTGGTQAAFWPLQLGDDSGSEHPSLLWTNLSVLDPTTTNFDAAQTYVEPSDLAPKLSPATRLLHAYELKRAQCLCERALENVAGDDIATRQEDNGLPCRGGSKALHTLFGEVDETVNTLSVLVPERPTGIFLLSGSSLIFGILRRVVPKPGWTASFLHRSDVQSMLVVQRCEVDGQSGLVYPHGDREEVFQPWNFVCGAPLCLHCETLILDADGLERWREMSALLPCSEFGGCVDCDYRRGSSRSHGRGDSRRSGERGWRLR